MENELKQLEEIKKQLVSLQADVESKGDENGEKVEKLNKLMEEFTNILNNLNLNNEN